jgi:hypothetical protein
MALIVETGAGIADADALVDVAFVDDYAARFGKTGWAELDLPTKEIRIRVASQFIHSKFPFPGRPLYSYQSFFFPAYEFRVRGHLVEGVPVQVKNATAELAIMAGTVDLYDSLVARNYIYRRVDVGGVEKEERWSNDSGPVSKPFAIVEMILAPLMEGSLGEGVRSVRLMPGL